MLCALQTMTQPYRIWKTSKLLPLAIFLASQVLFLDAQSSPSKSKPEISLCLNPDNKYGQCISLTNCQPLYKILKERPINRQSLIFLQKATAGCGFSGEEPNVCCLIKDIGNVNNNNGGNRKDTSTNPTTETSTLITPTPTTTSPRNSIQATVESLDSSKDIQERIRTHRNLRLLPTIQTCGQVLTLNNIIGGHDAGLGTYPFMILLGFADIEGEIQYACGGTLINKNYVLTAAHCVAKLPLGFKLSNVRIGEYDLREEIDCNDGICANPVQNIKIQEIIYHENYDKTFKKENDIAILRLQKSAEFNTFVTPICLPLPQVNVFTKGINVANMTKLTVAGWGRTNFQSEDSSAVLQEVKVPIITKEECNRFYKNNRRLGEIDDGRFCSGGEANKDSCKGDSGGPIMAGVLLKTSTSPQRPITRVFQFGIVSVGPAHCGSEGQPALYTKVSHFIPWILDHLRP